MPKNVNPNQRRYKLMIMLVLFLANRSACFRFSPEHFNFIPFSGSARYIRPSKQQSALFPFHIGKYHNNIPPIVSSTQTGAYAYDAFLAIEGDANIAQCRELPDGRCIVINDISEGTISHPSINAKTDSNASSLSNYDVSSPREWMEYLEASTIKKNRDEGYHDVLGGAGAYTVIRCDGVYDTEKTKNSHIWHIWGKTYHLNRLQESFQTLLNDCLEQEEITKASLKNALKDSSIILDQLLLYVEKKLKKSEYDQKYKKDIQTFQFMTTLFWTIDANDNKNVFVRGHVRYIQSFPTKKPPSLPNPIITSMVVPEKDDDQSESKLPQRYNNLPTSKASSWCRIRRPLEDVKSFKPKGVGEVLLTRNNSSSVFNFTSIELLEGLTSNFFAIFVDGTIRTADDGVLLGYARQLILESCGKCGLKYDPKPILIEDLINGQCMETFVSSSIRLIVPVQKILLHKNVLPRQYDCINDFFDNSMLEEWIEIWSMPSKEESKVYPLSYTEILYNSLLEHT